jgi:hypothetical protein
MTIDQMITRLTAIREKSPFDGDTTVCICIQDQPYIPIDSMNDDFDDRYEEDGCVVFLESKQLNDIMERYYNMLSSIH